MQNILPYLVLFLIYFFGISVADGLRDLQEICQLTLDMSGLDKYFHTDKLPERKPLLILRNEYVEREPALFKFGEKAQYVSRNAIKAKPRPYLEFSKIDLSGQGAYIEFLYPPEGLAGKVNLFKDERGWHIKSYSITER